MFWILELVKGVQQHIDAGLSPAAALERYLENASIGNLLKERDALREVAARLELEATRR